MVWQKPTQHCKAIVLQLKNKLKKNSGLIKARGTRENSRISLDIETVVSQCQFALTLPFISGGSDGKESACNAGDLGLIPGLGRSPGKGNGYPLQYSCLENPHGRRSLAGYSPWGREKLDMTEQQSTASLHTHGFLPLPSHMCL